MPAVFVLIWSTGFVVARYGMPHAPPLTFLSWRYALSLLAFMPWIWLARARWPEGPSQWAHLAVTGALMHAGYLGGVWAAVRMGMSAGTVALIVGLQPLLTALWVHWVGKHQVARLQVVGLLLGLVGLGLVVGHKLSQGVVTVTNLALALLALASITVGTLYQKRFVKSGDVRCANLVQLAAAWLVTAPLSLLEAGQMQWHPELIGALSWSVLVLTLGGSSLLLLLIQGGAATRVTSLMYLVPPCTALLAWLLFGETIGLTVGLGMLLCAAGVAAVLRSPS
ncbi:MAG: DMT family transporter [Burkholderiales bacterium]|nr:DMT family transporter [Burkholderiales bacterium]